ncbi:MAG: bifunctional phosphoribosyl-AMP cyclohydrolase/phosphoribosyl-ATP diphosphatase HisIE [Deltaproteobacteria bacterium]|nr:bifunctional phosphoribosyl-AMP cyclohydrolase/phosphoribosyl-ATP diphosphatase HisIE [Deltaproteobacteria bacterium]NND30539.1 bifunctional phosphoribosyl-AMP cyclohydrolase/phosphoribosyl-ATP diphosphatase HisIE [Myxococcales bacterium]MBT8465643.1 bifunctional phosphoribosyl-AMP cyclohydrolase/phosphoribosyl-ATP diphosphatase HisIE [Deltaproteobacteria bacterium]MBT8482513.1 bifunctional phosphoribosyl-AMP cyclohydrolase/phosphoribosyl-ATP diphosphatase HisIE [Deltaproteobacteria bacterium
MSVDALKFNDQGLVAVIAQDAESGAVRMMAYANEAAIRRTLETGAAHFYSRSRKQLWKKGETSGHTLAVRDVWVDCDGDTLIYMVDPEGPSCHTGAETCFFRRLERDGRLVDAQGEVAEPTLLRLERTLQTRKASDASKSYTKTLLDAGPAKVDAKIREEAAELGRALIDESDARVASEAGDLTYHMLVGLVLRDVSLRKLLTELSKRFGRSGHEEKSSRQ